MIIIILFFIDYLSFEDVSWFVNKYTDLLKTDCKTEYINNVSYIFFYYYYSFLYHNTMLYLKLF